MNLKNKKHTALTSIAIAVAFVSQGVSAEQNIPVKVDAKLQSLSNELNRRLEQQGSTSINSDQDERFIVKFKKSKKKFDSKSAKNDVVKAGGLVKK